MADNKRLTQTQLMKTIADACQIPGKTAKQALPAWLKLPPAK